MAEISEEVKKFLEHNLADGFGCDINTVVEACKGSSRFAYLLGRDPSSVKSLLETVKSTGMSPELFAAKEIQEGYNSSWGWHNHTVPQGDPTQDAIYVVNYTKEVANSTGGQPAWDYPGGGTVGVVPMDVQEAGNAHYASLAQGTIGRAYVTMTAAATWSMYYPQALKASVNGVQDYGNPLQGCIDLIKAWGGTIGGSSTPGDQSSSGAVDTTPTEKKKSSSSKSKGSTPSWFYLQNNNLWPIGSVSGSGSGSGSGGSGLGTGTNIPTQGGNTTSDVDLNERIAVLTRILRAKVPGARDENIAGIVGNFMTESSMRPEAYEADYTGAGDSNKAKDEPTVEAIFGSWSAFMQLYANTPVNKRPHEPSYLYEGKHYLGYGLGQWTAGRTYKLFKWAKSNNRRVGTVETQVEYLLAEEGYGAGVKSFLTQNMSINDATAWFMSNWEGINNGTLGERQQHANTYIAVIRSV